MAMLGFGAFSGVCLCVGVAAVMPAMVASTVSTVTVTVGVATVMVAVVMVFLPLSLCQQASSLSPAGGAWVLMVFPIEL